MIQLNNLLILTFSILCVSSISSLANEPNDLAPPVPIYWIDGPGDWTDVAHWSLTSGGTSDGILPTDSHNVIIDSNSGLLEDDILNIPAGDYYVHDFYAVTGKDILIHLEGVSGQSVTMNVYGDIVIQPNITLTYESLSIFDNKWRIDNSGDHQIQTGGNDMCSLELDDVNATYNMVDDLYASQRIRMYSGIWNTNNHTVNSGILLFQDSNGSSNPLTKVFNAGSSNIYCDTWRSTLAYQSLTVTGTYTIHTPQFLGSPGTSFQSFSFHEIVLEEFEDIAPGGTSQIEHNNFVCAYCEIHTLRIEDTGRTQLAGIFTITNLLEVENAGSEILFNGGNSYEDEVVINGTISVPEVLNCEDERVIFKDAYTEYTTFISDNDLLIEDAILENIKTQGPGDFELSNSIQLGVCEGWVSVSDPNPLTFYWNGTGTTDDWDDPNNWDVGSGGPNGCLPSIVDNVVIDNRTVTNIRIPSSYTATCNDFNWINTKSIEMRLDGVSTNKSELEVSGDFYLDPTAKVIGIDLHEIIFNSTLASTINTNGVPLPDIRFIKGEGGLTLIKGLDCDDLRFESGTFVTNDNDVEANSWTSQTQIEKYYDFGSSHITVNGEFVLSQYTYSNVTVDPGTSLIECEELTSTVPVLYDLKLINSSTLSLPNYPLELNELIIAGTGEVRTYNDITANYLIFKDPGTSLAIDPNDDFVINEFITSNATLANPAILKSRTSGTRAEIQQLDDGICVDGIVEITDIEAQVLGVMHAPEGIDGGNNMDINFDDGAGSSVRYWIGQSGVFTDNSNWSIISGGCPHASGESGASDLIFDDNSFYTADEVVTLPTTVYTNQISFYNLNKCTFNITGQLTVSNLNVLGGYLDLNGTAAYINNTVTVDNLGVFDLGVADFTTTEFLTPSGLVVMRNGTTMQVD